MNSNHHFSVDCSNAHRGLFAGIMIIVLTIISLIMFFVLANEPSGSEEDNLSMAEFEVNIVELALYILTTIIVIVAMVQMRSLKYDRKIGGKIIIIYSYNNINNNINKCITTRGYS